MDWATNDYTQIYADTIYVPEPEADEGIYLLDEAARETDPWDRDRLRTSIRPFGGRDGGVGRVGPTFRAAYPPSSRGPLGSAARPVRGHKEGYYTGGNIISAPRDNLHRVFGAAWDERPQHYNPRSGTDWAHLVPDPRDRPYGGGPAPSLAFPMIPQSAALDNPWNNSAPTAPSRECERFGGPAPSPSSGGCGADRSLQLVKIFLLIVVVVLLAMTLMAAGRLARDLELAVGEAVGLLRSPAVT